MKLAHHTHTPSQTDLVLRLGRDFIIGVRFPTIPAWHRVTIGHSEACLYAVNFGKMIFNQVLYKLLHYFVYFTCDMASIQVRVNCSLIGSEAHYYGTECI